MLPKNVSTRHKNFLSDDQAKSSVSVSGIESTDGCFTSEQTRGLVSPGYLCPSRSPSWTKRENDKTKSVEELLSLQKLDTEEIKMYNLSFKRDERYPCEFAAGKFTDPKQIKAVIEKLLDERNISEERLQNLTTQYLTQLGGALSTLATTEHRPSLLYEHTKLQDTCIVESDNLLVPSMIRFTNKLVHRRRPCTPTSPAVTVPSHIVQKPPKPPERGKQILRENLTTLLRSRSIRRRREDQASSRGLFDSLDMEGRLKEKDRLPKISYRQELEKRYIDEAAQARHCWYADGMARHRAKVQIVVVGAGLAGLSAAADLLRRGFTDIVILEASDRVGGRLHSVCLYGDGKCNTWRHENSKESGLKISQYSELGAPAWVIEDSTHSVFEFARDQELIIRSRRLRRSQCQVMTADGKHLDETMVSSALRFCAHLDRDTKILASNQHGCSSLAYSDYIRVRKRHLLAGLQKDKEKDLALAIDSITNIWRLASGDSEGDMAADLKGQYAIAEAETFTHYIDIPIEKAVPSVKPFKNVSSYLHLKKIKQPQKFSFGNTGRLIDSLMKNFPPGMVKCQKRVRRVDWSSFYNRTAKDRSVRKVKIFCDDGKVYRADHLIMAVPLGHLKKFADEMFTPSLPRYKVDAMNKMGVGTVSKILLFYHQPPWQLPFHLVWTGKQYKDTDRVADSLSSCRLQLLTSERQLGVLEVTLLGKMPKAAAKDDAHVAREISLILETFLTQLDPSSAPKCKKTIPPPDNIIRSSWGEDPLYNGSHPYLKRGCENKDVDRLASSVNFRKLPVIQFAGDYTWPDYTRLTHSARSSGLREAERLSHFYNNYFGYENNNPLSIPTCNS